MHTWFTSQLEASQADDHAIDVRLSQNAWRNTLPFGLPANSLSQSVLTHLGQIGHGAETQCLRNMTADMLSSCSVEQRQEQNQGPRLWHPREHKSGVHPCHGCVGV